MPPTTTPSKILIINYLQTLRDRAAYLTNRIEAKKKINWEYTYDENERAALLWAISQLEKTPNV